MAQRLARHLKTFQQNTYCVEMTKSCCVPGCPTTAGSGIPLHSFPNPTHSDLLKLWVSKIGGQITELGEDEIFRKRRVCRRHFEPVYLYLTKLCPLAVPSLHLPGGVDDLMMIDEPPVVASSSPEVAQTPVLQKVVVSDIIIEKPSNASKVPVDTLPTKKEEELSRKILKLELQLERVQKQNNQYRRRLAMERKLKKRKAFQCVVGNMSEAAKSFFAMQVSQFKKKPKGRRFSLEEKILCLSLFKRSPTAYRMLGNICILPKRRTLQNLLQKICRRPEVNQTVFNLLKKEVSVMQEHLKYCSLIFDEMAISPSYKRKDCINGVVGDGDKKNKQISDHVFVFILRGFEKTFKEPIAYSYCSGSTKTDDLITHIKIIIKEIEETGLKVVATVCDKSALNTAAINSLLNETKNRYLREGKEWQGGFFETENRQVFPIFNSPNLVVNNLLVKDLHFNDGKAKIAVKDLHFNDGKAKIAERCRIGNVYRGPGYKGVRIVPAQHDTPNLIPTILVKHCT